MNPTDPLGVTRQGRGLDLVVGPSLLDLAVCVINNLASRTGQGRLGGTTATRCRFPGRRLSCRGLLPLRLLPVSSLTTAGGDQDGHQCRRQKRPTPRSLSICFPPRLHRFQSPWAPFCEPMSDGSVRTGSHVILLTTIEPKTFVSILSFFFGPNQEIRRNLLSGRNLK